MTTDDEFVQLGQLLLDFGQVNRVTYHPDRTTLESDSTHTVMLGVMACALALNTEPQLDSGLIAQFALVHDLVEVYAGDTDTLTGGDALLTKKDREHDAYERIKDQFWLSFPWLPNMIWHYEQQELPEARFVRAVDKLMPKITHILNNGRTFEDSGVDGAHVRRFLDKQREDLMTYAGEFEGLMRLRDLLVSRVIAIAYDRHVTPVRPV